MSEQRDAYRIEPAGPRDALGAELRAALASDPDGGFLARGADGSALGHAVAVLRGDVVQLLALEVAPAERGRGIGRALYEAIRSYARGRAARALEVLAPAEGDGLGFLLARRLTVRSAFLSLERALPAPPARVALSPQRLAPGPAFSGWVADLDRETRGFSRTPDWIRWARDGEVWALRSRGRPEAAVALRVAENVALLGPVAARRPEEAAAALAFLSGRAAVLGAARARIVLPVESRSLLGTALAAGFRVGGTRLLLGSRPHGDFRRYAASPGPFA